MRHFRTVARTLLTAISTFLLTCSVFAQTDTLVKLDQNWKPGWNYDQSNWYHHASQGTMLMPYDWFMALEQPTETPSKEPKMFSDPKFLRQFGFLPSEQNNYYNPGNLPIGFAISENWVDPNNATPKMPVRALGLTCAACHTGEIKYGNHRIQIEGGSSMINIGGFQIAMGKALVLTNLNPEKFQAFANRWFKSQPMSAEFEGRAKAALKEEVDNFTLSTQASRVPMRWQGLEIVYLAGAGK
jgi:hypothetical protein